MRAADLRFSRRLTMGLLTVGATGVLGAGLAPEPEAEPDPAATRPAAQVEPTAPAAPDAVAASTAGLPEVVAAAEHAAPDADRGADDDQAASADAEPADDATDEQPDPGAAPSRTVWDRLADCESGDWVDGGASFVEGSARWDYGIDFAHDGYEQFEGGLNFHPGTWEAYRGPDMPGHAGRASREQQIAVAEQVKADQGWQAWPVCSRKLDLAA